MGNYDREEREEECYPWRSWIEGAEKMQFMSKRVDEKNKLNQTLQWNMRMKSGKHGSNGSDGVVT